MSIVVCECGKKDWHVLCAECARLDLAGMREFQAKYIAADQELRALKARQSGTYHGDDGLVLRKHLNVAWKSRDDIAAECARLRELITLMSTAARAGGERYEKRIASLTHTLYTFATDFRSTLSRLTRFEAFADWVYHTRLDRKKVKRMARAMCKGQA